MPLPRGGRGVDLAFNMPGARCSIRRSTASAMARGIAPVLDIEHMFRKVQGAHAFILGPFLQDRDLIGATLVELAACVKADRLKIDVGGTFRLAEAAETHRPMKSGSSTGKLIILPQ